MTSASVPVAGRPPLRRRRVGLLATLLAVALGSIAGAATARAGAAAAATSPADTALAARDSLAAAIAVRQRTQQRREQWQRERDELQRRYRELEARVAAQRRDRDRRRAAVAALTDRIASLERRRVEAERLRGTLDDTLAVLLDGLRRRVDADLPFLQRERRARLREITALLADPEAPAAEKLRRLLEALQIEAAYGSGTELGEAGITVAGRELRVRLLRLGRIALLWLAPDGSRCGLYDPARGEWVELPGRWRRSIARAMEMAAHTRPLELIELPVGRVGS